jgi:hypothetical protein
LDGVDRAVWVLPFLALLDVVSTFYVGSLGYSLQYYERGFFASLFLLAGSAYTYLYAAIYTLIMIAVAYALWYIKNKELKPSRIIDKVFFLVLNGILFYMYLRLTAAFTMNFLLPSILERGLNVFLLTVIIYVSSALSLGSYLWQPVLAWVRPHDKERKRS